MKFTQWFEVANAIRKSNGFYCLILNAKKTSEPRLEGTTHELTVRTVSSGLQLDITEELDELVQGYVRDRVRETGGAQLD